MQTNRAPTTWMALAFAAAVTLMAVILAVFGTGEHGTKIALRATARLSFLLFWLAYAGAGLTALTGGFFGPVKRHGRDLGLAFASAHTVHVLLIGWLCWIGAAPDYGVFRFFVPPLACVYILALFSIERLQRKLGYTGWWLLRTVAMTYIDYAFLTDFLVYPRHGVLQALGYLPFAALGLAGPILYFAAIPTRSLRANWRASDAGP